jgi:CubicO group peptidase (beta-lactamase class C family)
MSAAVDSFAPLRRIADEAVAARVTPGLVVLAGQAGRPAIEAAFGLRQVDPAPAAAEVATIYDLASLTKAVVTSVLAMQAVAEGRLRLDERVTDLVPGFSGGEKDRVLVRHLLCHAAGCAPTRPFYERSEIRGSAGRAAVIAAVAAEPLLAPPGARSAYSDLGFILLGDLLEQRFGARLDHLAQERIFVPCGAAPLAFAAGAGAAVLPLERVAPTERCAVRGSLVHGEVHDLNAWAMGGVAGHAGLFGSAAAVARVAWALLAAYRGGSPGSGAPIVDRDVLREFWRPAGVPGSTWRLGWDGPSAHGSLAGERISRGAVGHLGFTGCSLWMDPEREALVLVLSNRVHPIVRDDPCFRALRPALNDAALAGLGL